MRYDNVASESSPIAKSLQCVLARSGVFTSPPNFQFLVVFDQKLCKNIKKVLNLIWFMLFSFVLHFVFYLNQSDIEMQIFSGGLRNMQTVRSHRPP